MVQYSKHKSARYNILVGLLSAFFFLYMFSMTVVLRLPGRTRPGVMGK